MKIDNKLTSEPLESDFGDSLAEESAILLRLRQLGDAGLRAAMDVLKADKSN